MGKAWRRHRVITETFTLGNLCQSRSHKSSENDETECPTKLLTSAQINMLPPLQSVPEDHKINFKTIDEIIMENTKGNRFGIIFLWFCKWWMPPSRYRVLCQRNFWICHENTATSAMTLTQDFDLRPKRLRCSRGRRQIGHGKAQGKDPQTTIKRRRLWLQ